MRALIQRVTRASVTVEGQVTGSIGTGMLVLCGFGADETAEDLNWTARKICGLRIFDDENGVMNLPLAEVGGDILAVSQFTLMASTKKGNRPSYVHAAPPEISEPLFEAFKRELSAALGHEVQSGIFGADMNVDLLNDGPVTIWIDSKNKL